MPRRTPSAKGPGEARSLPDRDDRCCYGVVHAPKSENVWSLSTTDADISPLSSSIVALQPRPFSPPWSTRRPSVWVVVLSVDFRPKLAVTILVLTSILMKLGAPAVVPSGAYRSQFAASHSMIVVIAQISGLVPSKLAASAGVTPASRQSPARAMKPAAVVVQIAPVMLGSLVSATRWRGLVDGVAAALHARGERAVVVGLLPGRLLLLRRDLRLVVAVLLIAPHATEDRAGRRSGGRTLAGITADGTADGADRRAPGRATHHLTALRRRWWRGRHPRPARLLHGPPVTFGLILLLLLRALALLRINHQLLRADGAGEHDADRHDAQREEKSRPPVHSVLLFDDRLDRPSLRRECGAGPRAGLLDEGPMRDGQRDVHGQTPAQ